LEHLDFKRVDVGGLVAFQANPSAWTYSGIARWMPETRLADNILAGLDVGISGLKSNSTGTFAVLEYAAVGRYELNPQWSARLILGAQTWVNNGGTSLAAGAGGVYALPTPLFEHIDSVFLTYMPVFQSKTTHEISAGVGVKF
jgi:hypothetical protein